MLLCEHMFCVTFTFKMTERVEKQICIKFCMKLEHSSEETSWMIQKAAAMGNWWLAALSWQHAHSCIMSEEECFGETSNHPGDSAPLQPRFGTLWLLAFPKTKITFERKEISDHWWDSGKYDGAAEIGECIPRYLLWRGEGDWGVIVLFTTFLVSCIFSNKCLYFS